METNNGGENMNLTPFGQKVRELRIQARVRLNAMAEAIGYSEAYLSAVETGRKPVNDELLEKTIEYFTAINNNFSKDDLVRAADESKTAINVERLEDLEKGVLGAFARKLPGATDQVRLEILDRLNKVLEDVS
jgi:transcriptional regulator with XRE-family HTH domain